MAQNFFFRKPLVPASSIDAIGKFYDAATNTNGFTKTEIPNYYFTVKINKSTAVQSGGAPGFQLADFKTSSIAHLVGATVTMEGDFGSLMRFEVNCKLHQDQFNTFDSTFLGIGSDVEVEFAGNGQAKSSYIAKLYDASWTINPDGTVDIGFKAVGVGQGGLYVNIYDGADHWNTLHFRADYDAEEGIEAQLTQVSGLVDYLDHRVQLDTGTMENNSFDPRDQCWPGRWKVRYNEFRGDKIFKSEYSTEQDLWTQQQRGVYITLGYIIDTLNRQFLFASTQVNIALKAEAELHFEGMGNMNSANPIECIFNYGSGDPAPITYSPGNTYVPTNSNKLQGWNAIGTDGGSFNISTTANGLSDILINRDIIKGIFVEASAVKQSANTAKLAGIEFSIPEFHLSIETFFTKLFSIIKANSGGAIDLVLLPDVDSIANYNPKVHGYKLAIYNLRGPEKYFEPFVFTKGMTAIREVKIVSKVPSATAMAAFGAIGTAASDDAKAGNAISLPGNPDSEAVADKGTGYPTVNELIEAKNTVQFGDFEQSKCDELRGILKRYVDNESAEETGKKTSFPWPVELKITIVGIDGWRFGDTISYDQLPARYRDKRGSLNVAFTITRAVHTFGTEWTTELTSQCRFVGGGA